MELAEADGVVRHRRRDLYDVDDVSFDDLGERMAALVIWRGTRQRIVISDRIAESHVWLAVQHALTHRDGHPGEEWGETTAWCNSETCWAAQTWLPACYVDVEALAPPA